MTGPRSLFTTPPSFPKPLLLLLLDVSLSFYDRLACLCCALVLILFYLTCYLLLLHVITSNDLWARSILSCPSHIWKESVALFFLLGLEILFFNKLFFPP